MKSTKSETPADLEGSTPIDLQRLEDYFNLLDIGIVLVDQESRILFSNQWILDRLPGKSICGHLIDQFLGKRDLKAIHFKFERALGHRVTQLVSPILHTYLIAIPDPRFKDGFMRQKGLLIPVRYQNGTTGKTQSGVLLQIIDVSHAYSQINLLNTANQQKNDEIEKRKTVEKNLEQSLAEKEILLKELQHRVKNNLQIISSLIDLQKNKTNNPYLTQALNDCQCRVQSISYIHSTLYNSDSVSSINIEHYLTDLAKSIVGAYHLTHDHIEFSIQVDPLDMIFDQASHLGLLVNELVTNAMKYAFPHRKPGKLEVILKRIDDADIQLSVSDDGIGLPKDMDWDFNKGMGLNLVKLIVQNQLNGTISIKSVSGTCYTIRFLAKPV